MAEINNVIAEASQDLQTIEDFVNLPADSEVYPRLLPSVNVGTLAGARQAIFEAGGLPATPFATKALMTASALVDGDYAVVTDDAVLENIGMYRKEDGVWVYSKYGSTELANNYTDVALSEEKEERLKSVDATVASDKAFVFVDEDGFVGASIDDMANIEANNIAVDYEGNIAFGVKDELGQYALIVESDGSLRTTLTDKLVSDLDGCLYRLEKLETGSAVKVEKYKGLQKTDYMHGFSYGQSLSRGSRATPVVSTTQPYSNKTFTSGVLPRLMDTHDYTGFKPLVEEAVGHEGETPVSSMLNNFVQQQELRGGVSDDWKMVGTAPGRGSYSVAQLSKGSPEYSGMLAQVQSAYDIAQAEGKTYSVWFLAWTQGEQDYNTSTSFEAYRSLLLKLKNDFASDVRAITGQAHNPFWVMYQTTSHRRYSQPEMQIARAQLNIAQEVDEVVVACPTYFLNLAEDGVHLQNNDSYQLGRYYAKALDYTLNNADKWQPLQPVNTFKQGNILSVEFNKSGLTLDTDSVSLTHNHGFDVHHNGVLLDIITGVTISGGDRVNITLSAILPEGATLSYGKGRAGDPTSNGKIDGARGNLRDSAGDTDNYIDNSGATRYMHNWCVFFEQVI